jgi:hypothetical protein
MLLNVYIYSIYTASVSPGSLYNLGMDSIENTAFKNFSIVERHVKQTVVK